jgi:hypothetical protein
MEEAWAPEYAYVGIILDMDAIEKLQVSCFDFHIECPHITPARANARRHKMGNCCQQKA